MLAITEEGLGLKQVVRQDGGRVGNVEVSSSLIYLDMNTPEEYERALDREAEFRRTRVCLTTYECEPMLAAFPYGGFFRR